MFEKKIDLDMIVPTSKITLKTTCLRACGGDIERAQKLYDFYARDLGNLPEVDIVPPSAFQQAKDAIGSIFSWTDGYLDKIAGYYNLFQQMRVGAPITPSAPPANVPPIPTE